MTDIKVGLNNIGIVLIALAILFYGFSYWTTKTETIKWQKAAVAQHNRTVVSHENDQLRNAIIGGVVGVAAGLVIFSFTGGFGIVPLLGGISVKGGTFATVFGGIGGLSGAALPKTSYYLQQFNFEISSWVVNTCAWMMLCGLITILISEFIKIKPELKEEK